MGCAHGRVSGGHSNPCCPSPVVQGGWIVFELEKAVEGLKEKVIRGGAAKLVAQAGVFVLRIGFIAVMARLLGPEDFGLVAMVVAVTSFYDLFTSAGLSLAAVQRATITEEQVHSLFWVNLLVGATLF